MYYEVKLKVMKPNKDGLEKEVKEQLHYRLLTFCRSGSQRDRTVRIR